MPQRFAYIYLRNPLSSEQIEDIDQWLHQYGREVRGRNGHWQFKLDNDAPGSDETLEMNLENALPDRPDRLVVDRLNELLGYVPQQKLDLASPDEGQLSMLAQCLAARFEGIVHYQVAQRG